MIREINQDDICGLLELYSQLHENVVPRVDNELLHLWEDILEDKHHHIIVAFENGKIVSSCVVIIVPNLTHNQRPYALIENVITDECYRKQGFASACLEYAKGIAKANNCYKIMLLTGSKSESTFNFYKKSGYNSDDKTGFIQWL